MKVFADLHIHSRYSRATSSNMNIENLSYYGTRKGLNLIGTGDFTHPLWLKELKEKLVKQDDVYRCDEMNFIPSSEVSLIYKKTGKTRKVHLVLLAPDFETVDQINDWIDSRGKRRDYDGRPIFGFTCPEFTEAMMSINKDIEVIAAHAWTPYFGVFGSMSGFDSIKECFEDQTKNIHALETGLSSDPEMNWRLSQLDKYTLVSNSDSHSPYPHRIGREANVFDFNHITYKNVLQAIRKKKNFLYTIEVDPAYGKYHFDGHRNCSVSLKPKQAMKINNICPVCKKPLTIGVEHRVEQLADREPGFKPEGAIPYKSLIPLKELISSVLNMGINTKKVDEIYQKYMKEFKKEFHILLEANKTDLMKIDEKIGNNIIKLRNNELKVEPGYDGVYGKLIIEKKKGLKDFI